ncbi:MAG TPA: PPOX class F420-dependent oxidoreductase [Acidimicrobiales bacterium]|nr:PPOX class F420-dependent oxidoreductase [Acidimicrobiales bacterium]
MTFTDAELAYLRSQPLGRLATVDGKGMPQVNPVGFRVMDDGTVVISGWSMASTRKYRNVARTARAALVVDDVASRDPWVVRGIEIRGRAEAVALDEPAIPGTTNDVIRVHPDTVFSWGVEPGVTGMVRRGTTTDDKPQGDLAAR